MYYSYVEIEYVATSFSPARTDLALKLLTINKGVRRRRKAAGGGGRLGSIWDAAIDDSSMATWDDNDNYVGGEQRAAC